MTMELPIDAALLDGMKYAELQKIAKKIGIKANVKAEKLVKSIREHLEGQSVEQQQVTVTEQQHDGQDCDNSETYKEPRVPRANKKVTERRGRKGRKGRKTAKESGEDEEVLVSGVAVDGLRRIDGATAHDQACDKPTSASKHSGRTPKATTPTPTNSDSHHTVSPSYMTTATTKTVTSHIQSPAALPVAARRTHTISPVKSPRANTPVVMTTKRRTHTISPVIQKVATPAKVGSASRSKPRTAAVTSGGSVKANKTKRKRPISGEQNAQPSKSKRVKREETCVEEKLHKSVSPGVKQVLDSLDNGLSDAQLKASITQAVARRVEERGAEVSCSKTLTIGGTNIPRFTALAKGLSVTKSVTTPGHKDWARIHQRTFEKMESIDVYLKKRDERMQSVSAMKVQSVSAMKVQSVSAMKVQSVSAMKVQSVSAMKVQDMTRRMRTALNSLKQIKTSPSAQTNKGARIVKPVLGGRAKVKSRLFQSPAPSFVPKVTSVSKMNLQFASNASCKRKTPLPCLASSAKENLMSPKAFDATRKSAVVATKRKSATTPFVFRGGVNQTQNQSTMEVKARQFDLQESLARKITWKPHRGKLQPFVNPDPHKAPPKEVKVQSRNDRRKKAQKHQANRRLDSQLSRRGITITS